MAATAGRARAPQLSREQLTLLALLVLSIAINYIDRGSLSVAQLYLRRDLGIRPEELGLTFSAFFWTYAPMQIVAGALADRFPARWVLGAGYMVWSVAMLATGFVTGIGMLLALRLVLGMGESVAYPTYSRLLAAGYREDQRGRANAWVDAGSRVGPATGILLGGLGVEALGWRFFFFALGVLSLAWLIPWWRVTLPVERVAAEKVYPSFARILKLRSAWGTFLTLLCGNYAWYFLVFWIPPYLQNERHFTQSEMAVLGSIPFWGIAVVTVASGWAADRWIAQGASVGLVRKGLIAAGFVSGLLLLPAVMVRSSAAAVVLLTVASAGLGMFSSNIWAVTQTLAGAEAAGRWTGAQNAIGNLPGMFGLWFTGWMVQATGQYLAAFAVVCGFLVLGIVSVTRVVGRVEPVKW